jgi:hypothetical protein
VIRLWHRVGPFRTLAVAVLLLGVVGGVFLGTDRQTQQRMSTSAQVSQSEQDELRDLRQNAADWQRATAASRAAQREAQSKANTAAAAAAAQAKAAQDAANRTRSAATTSKPFGPIPSSCNEYSGNQAIGCALLLQWGFGLDQMPCLQQMWMKESGWNERSRNASSGSYGIPQALPASKMAVYGSDYLTNPATQIKWGLDYIKNRYRTPCGAWTFWQAHHWY